MKLVDINLKYNKKEIIGKNNIIGIIYIEVINKKGDGFMKKKIIALSLVLTSVMTFVNPSLQAKALSNNYSTEIITEVKESFEKSLEDISKFGKQISENEYLIESDDYNMLVNIGTGDITHSFYENGTLVDSYTTNFYENIKNISIEDYIISSRETLATNTIPYKLNSLHYTIGKYSATTNSIYAQNSKNNYKSFTINGSYTSNSKVMNFVRGVDDAASKARLLVNSAGVSVAIGLIGILGIAGKVTVAAITTALKALGYVTLVGGATALTVLYNNFVDATINADHAYNAL